MGIQWYPGHMAKTKREIKEVLPLLDLIIEVVDARLPLSSRNPDLPALIKGKQSILLLNKADLADPEITSEWIRYYRPLGEVVFQVVDIGAFTVRYIAVKKADSIYLIPAELIDDLDDDGLVMGFLSSKISCLLPIPKDWEKTFDRCFEEKIFTALNTAPYWED